MVIVFEISKIESYSRALAEKLCNDFFGKFEAIKGDQILRITPVEQVNLFVIKNLFDRWKDEAAKLKSPYFNYESPEVKEALQNVQNKLSQNIFIRKEFFKPLLEKGIFDTLYLILRPEGYFYNEYASRTNIKLLDLKESEKFFKIRKSLIQSAIAEVERECKSEVSGKDLAGIMTSRLNESTISEQEKQGYLEQFSSMLKLEGSEAVSSVAAPVQEKPLPVETPPVPVVNKDKPDVQKESKIPLNTPGNILNEKFVAEQRTVNDLLKQQEITLAEKMSKAKIENIRTAISLSQKFLFVNVLFKGIQEEYEKALNDIDQCQNYQEALTLLNDQYALRYNWNFDQYEVKEFVEIVERKFS